MTRTRRLGTAVVCVGILLALNVSDAANMDSTGTAATLNMPTGVAIDSAGNVYVSDIRNFVILKLTPTGVVTTLAGRAGFSPVSRNIDGTGSEARFSSPSGVAADNAGNIYVIDNNTIRKVTPAGVVTTLTGAPGKTGYADGTGTAARFMGISGVATDHAGNIYVSDVIAIRKITPAGVVTTLAGAPVSAVGTVQSVGYADGAGVAARFSSPSGIATDSAGNIYVADTSNGVIRKITPAGVVTTLAGEWHQMGDADGTGAAARFQGPSGIVADSVGNVYVADTGNGAIRKISPAGVVTTLLGATGLGDPTSVAVDRSGNIYVVDRRVNAIRKITPAGMVTAFAGQLPKDGATFADTLCRYNERVIFSCRLKGKGGKTVSVCGSRIITATRGYMQYRYGKPGAVEIILPEQRGIPAKSFTGALQTLAKSETAWLRVRNGKFGYVVYGFVGLDDLPTGLAVQKDGKTIADLSCEESMSGSMPAVEFGESTGILEDAEGFDLP